MMFFAIAKLYLIATKAHDFQRKKNGMIKYGRILGGVEKMDLMIL